MMTVTLLSKGLPILLHISVGGKGLTYFFKLFKWNLTIHFLNQKASFSNKRDQSLQLYPYTYINDHLLLIIITFFKNNNYTGDREKYLQNRFIYL